MKKVYHDLVEKGLLREEKIDFVQIRKVLNKAQNDLKSARILLGKNQNENAFELAYEAMLSAGRAMVFSYGFRPRAQGSHKTVIEFSRRILKNSPEIIVKKFDRMRRKRHYLIYGIGLEISKTEAENAVKNASNFIKEATAIIEKRDRQSKLL